MMTEKHISSMDKHALKKQLLKSSKQKALTKSDQMAKKQSPEDTFYENLTLGLIKTLSNLPRVCNVEFERRQSCEKAQVINWEQRHCVYLPEDMKKFYLSTDGFVLHWSYQYTPNDIRRVGYIYFPHLLQVTLLHENVEPTVPVTTNITATDSSNTHPTGTTTAAPVVRDRWGNPTPIITQKTKVFELNNINNLAKVCMIYESTGSSNAKFYLLELESMKWQFLADTFSEYLRMSIAHLGLPFWELCFSSFGLPAWTEQLFLLLAPHLLEGSEQRRGRVVNPASEHPHNIIDPSIFRMKPKNMPKASAVNKLK